MNPKSAYLLIDTVCRDAPTALGRVLRPAGLALMLGIGSLSLGCDGGDSGVDAAADALPSAGDAYGIVNDAAADAFPSAGDAYGIMDDAAADALPSAGDAYGITADAGD